MVSEYPKCRGRECGNSLVNRDRPSYLVETETCSQECWSTLFVPTLVESPICPRCEKSLDDRAIVNGYCSADCEKGICSKCGWAITANHICPAKSHSDHQGSRYNEGKPRCDLIPGEVLLALGQHYEYGARKYAPNNWVKGFPYSDTVASLLRHLYAFQSGETLDTESGHHHMTAVVWNAVTLLYFELHPEVYAKFNDLLPTALPQAETIIPTCCPIPAEGPIEPCEHVTNRNIRVPIPTGYRELKDCEIVKENDQWFDDSTLEWVNVPQRREFVGSYKEVKHGYPGSSKPTIIRFGE